MNLFKQLVRSFFFYAQNEYEKILKKIEQDQQNKINITEKALKDFNDLQREQAMKERERELNERLHNTKREKAIETPQSKNYLGLNFEDINRMGGNIPGF